MGLPAVQNVDGGKHRGLSHFKLNSGAICWKQASSGKTNQRLSLMSVLCTCFCGTADVVQGRVELCVTCAGCRWGKQSPRKHAWKQPHVRCATAPRLRVWGKKRLLSLKMGKGGRAWTHTILPEVSALMEICGFWRKSVQAARFCLSGGQRHAAKFSPNRGNQAGSQGSSLTSEVAAPRKLPALLFWKVIKSFLEEGSVSEGNLEQQQI